MAAAASQVIHVRGRPILGREVAALREGDRAGPRAASGAEERRQRRPVDGVGHGARNRGQLEHGREQIDELDDVPDGLRVGSASGEAHEQWDTQVLVVEVLPVTQEAVVPESLAVIRRDDEQGVVGQAALMQGVVQPA